MKKRYVDWKELTGHVQEIARQITLSGWKPDIVVGVTRGGAIPAVMLSHYFDCKMVGLDVALRDHTDGKGWSEGPETNLWLPEDSLNGRQILIVDDINDSGATINWIKNDWEAGIGDSELAWHKGIRLATLFDKMTSKSELVVDYCSEELEHEDSKTWIVFPYEEFWNLR